MIQTRIHLSDQLFSNKKGLRTTPVRLRASSELASPLTFARIFAATRFWALLGLATLAFVSETKMFSCLETTPTIMVVQDSLTYGPAISSDSVQDITFKLELPTIKLHEAPSVDEDPSHESKPAIRPTVSFRDDVGVRVRKVEVCSGTTARRERKPCSRYVIRILSKSHLVSVRCSVHRCISQRSHPIHGMQ